MNIEFTFWQLFIFSVYTSIGILGWWMIRREMYRGAGVLVGVIILMIIAIPFRLATDTSSQVAHDLESHSRHMNLPEKVDVKEVSFDEFLKETSGRNAVQNQKTLEENLK